MSQINLEAAFVIGISVRTSNAAGESGTAIPGLWNRFISEGVISRIPNRLNDSVYCVYTAYESDYTAPYTTVIGCRVSSPDTIPEGMELVHLPEGTYEQVTVKGNLQEGIIFNAWTDIWSRPLKRSYQADFEIYDEKAADFNNAEVNIYVGII